MSRSSLLGLRTLVALCTIAVAAGRASGQVAEFYHVDAAGSVRVVTDADGAVVERHDYLPFGEEWQPTSAPQPLRFAGKERDVETGLDYFGARYLRASLGRFTSFDPVLETSDPLFNPQAWNRYAYANNNPLRYADPDGRTAIALEIEEFGRVVYTSAPHPALKVLGGVVIGVGIGLALAQSHVLEPMGDYIATHGVQTAAQQDLADLRMSRAEPPLPDVYVSKDQGKSAEDMAAELAAQLGKNSVPYRTPDKMGHIDLQGKAHFDKATGRAVPTPHVQEMPYDARGPNKKGETIREATKADVRAARKLAEQKAKAEGKQEK